jgi:hypothetical protein
MSIAATVLAKTMHGNNEPGYSFLVATTAPRSDTPKENILIIKALQDFSSQ